MVPTVAIVTNIVPSYRAGFYDRLFARKDLLVDVYCQSHIRGMNVRPIHDRYPRVHIVRAISADKEALTWQFLPWRKILFGYDVVFVDGNPRIVSHAMAASLLRLLGRKVVLWTMGHSYAANPLTEQIRLAWTRCFPRIFLYTEAEVRFLRARGFARHDLGAMNNGLDQTRIDAAIDAWPASRLEEWRAARGLKGHALLLSCARLDPKNRFEEVIAVLPEIIRRCGNVNWCVVGDGAAAADLKARVATDGLSEHVHFLGEIYQEEELAPWFLSASAFVHPAAIGLSLLHAFGYGLPVVTHGSAEHHGPEFSAFEDGRCGRSFMEGDKAGLAAAIVQLLNDATERNAIGKHVLQVARTQYNADVMVERFVDIARRAADARRDTGL